ncbi:MAG: GNAT family N-acetyltransferase [Bacteroidota bacterium]
MADVYHIVRLNQCTLDEIRICFNQAFSDYLIGPINLSQSILRWKIQRDGVDLSRSFGAKSAKGRLVGLLLTGVGEWQGASTFYNAGMGIIPDHRRNGLARKLYHALFEAYPDTTLLLECIAANQLAYAFYRSLGFEETRSLQCYKSPARSAAYSLPYKFVQIDAPTQAQLNPLASWNPSWQNSYASARRLEKNCRWIAALERENLIGCAAFDPDYGYVLQMAVHPDHRRKGFGRAMTKYMGARSSSLRLDMVNVDASHAPTDFALRSFGFVPTVRQVEMIRVPSAGSTSSNGTGTPTP